jgi:hypothetical protein
MKYKLNDVSAKELEDFTVNLEEEYRLLLMSLQKISNGKKVGLSATRKHSLELQNLLKNLRKALRNFEFEQV